MSDHIKITKSGIKSFIWNTERRDRHDIISENDHFKLIDTKSNKEILISKNKKDLFKLFWDEKEVECIWSELRLPCKIDRNISKKDIYKLIEKDECFKFIIESLIKNEIDELNISKNIQINNNKLNIFYQNSPSECINYEVTATVNNNSIIINNFNPTALNLISCLFKYKNRIIKIKKDGFYYKNKKITSDVINHLFDYVSIDAGVTLKDIMIIVNNDELLKQFIEMYSWCKNSDEFLKEANSSNKTNKNLKYLDIIQHIKINDGNLEDYYSFYAVDNEDKLKSISLIDIEDLANCVVKAKDSAIINHSGTEIKTNGVSPSLIDVLGTIYWDISFYGSPTQIKEFKKTLNLRKEPENPKDKWSDLI